jgi:hypothetical protein
MRLLHPQADFRIWGRSYQKTEKMANFYGVQQSDSVQNLMQNM